MNRDTILAMPAGRELDALIWLMLEGKPLDLSKCRYVDGDVQPHVGYPGGHISPPPYSTSIEAAWKVMEKMETAHGWDSHNGIIILRDEDGWYVEFPLPGWDYACTPTLPHSICLAALLAAKHLDR